MAGTSRFRLLALALAGGASATTYYYNLNNNKEPPPGVNSYQKDAVASVKWDYNWDRRDPKSLMKGMKIHNESDQNEYKKKIESKKATAARHIILIRHGQYNTQGVKDTNQTLTKLGRLQAEATGKRLKELGFPYSLIVKSTLKRAQETSQIIEQYVKDVEVVSDSLLVEGAPIKPEPSIEHWEFETDDGERIEAAFRKYIHRADPKQKKDTYTIIVCHANVIRYFVCRALQFPPEGWLRLDLSHGSITWLVIHPSGRVALYCLGDSGHIPPHNISIE